MKHKPDFTPPKPNDHRDYWSGVRLVIGFCFLLITQVTLWSQQLPQFTQYMYNTISINPAYAGSRETLSAVLLYRSQWSGLQGGPKTLTASVHSPLRNDRIGVGFSFINDQLGYENFNYAYADFSYSIQTGRFSKLSFGLKAGLTQYNLDQELLNDPGVINDPFFQNLSNRISPNFGAGVYWHSLRWYLGLSTPRILNSDDLDPGSDSEEFKAAERTGYYLTGGYVFEINPDFQLRPSFLVKAVRDAELSYDISLLAQFYEKFWIGVNYRPDDSVGGIADFSISPQFRIGYAYEYSISDIRPYTSGTHEFILLFDLRTKDTRYKSPRYF